VQPAVCTPSSCMLRLTVMTMARAHRNKPQPQEVTYLSLD
jgi:hypothetical protein